MKIGENIRNLNDINAVWVTSETVSNIGNLLLPLLGFPQGFRIPQGDLGETISRDKAESE